MIIYSWKSSKSFIVLQIKHKFALLDSTGKVPLLRKHLSRYFICITYLFRFLCLSKLRGVFAIKSYAKKKKNYTLMFPKGRTSKALLSNKDRISTKVLPKHDFKQHICRKRKRKKKIFFKEKKMKNEFCIWWILLKSDM